MSDYWDIQELPEPSEEPKHGDHGTCATCGKEIEYYEYSNPNTLTAGAWWEHVNLSEDGHKAELGGPA